jgi:hypothetical protein
MDYLFGEWRSFSAGLPNAPTLGLRLCLLEQSGAFKDDLSRRLWRFVQITLKVVLTTLVCEKSYDFPEITQFPPIQASEKTLRAFLNQELRAVCKTARSS